MVTTKLQYEKIASINDETNELHPLLHQLLPHLPHVKDVTYTHGSNEMGADFVAQKFDPTLNDHHYVGVIAKTTKIHQDLSDIERQIEECRIPRLIAGGTKQTHLTEIWVITTKNVTNNAKEKIHHKYASSNINFIDGDKLTHLVDEYIPYYWHDVPGSIGTYLQRAWIRNRELDLQSTLLPEKCASLYIDLDLMQEDEDGYEKSRPARRKTVNVYSELKQNKVLLIEGAMGAGKSKLLRHMLSELATPTSFNESKLIPVYLTYRDFLRAYDGNIAKCVKETLREATRDVRDQEATVLLLVDGIDEVIEEKSASAERLGELVEQVEAESSTKLVITTRPMKLIDRELEIHRSVKRYYLKPLSTTNILAFIQNICRELKLSTRLVEDIKRSHLFRQLPRNPIAAILLSNLLAQNEQELPSNLTDLYAKSLELMLGRWDVQKGLFTVKEYEAAETVCCLLGKYVMDNELIRVATEEVKQKFRQYLNDRNLDVDADKLFEKVTLRSGVLADDQESQTIRFRHRSFAEFLYAKLLTKAGGLRMDERAWQLYWANTYFFYFGIKRDCPDLLEEVLACPIGLEAQRWLRIINVPQYFLAAFSTPYRVVEHNLYKLFLDTARVFTDIKTGKVRTALSSLPEMQLLWFMRFIMRECYAFAFFRRALESTALRIEESLEEPDIKAIALFLVGTVGIELGEQEPFRLLIENKKLGELPLSVSCAVECEMKMNKELGRSPLMRKHKKRWRRITKSSRSFQALTKKLFDEPMIRGVPQK